MAERRFAVARRRGSVTVRPWPRESARAGQQIVRLERRPLLSCLRRCDDDDDDDNSSSSTAANGAHRVFLSVAADGP